LQEKNPCPYSLLKIIQAICYCLKRALVDNAFLDLTLPDATGLLSFQAVNEKLRHSPIVVLSGLSDTALAIECIALGAQDYLLKNELDARILGKSIRYSIERKRNLEKIEQTVKQYELIGKVTNDLIWQWDFATKEIKRPQKRSSITAVMTSNLK
jgi:two-component system, NarL family, sensor histidine kinase UhpB